MSERPTDPHHSTFVAADSEPLSEENEKSEQRLLKVAAAVEQQLAQAEQQLAQATGETPDVVVLPDGRVINLDQLLNAIQSGSDSIPLDDGDAISVEDLLVAFGMEPHVPEIGDEERVENTQASFTPGPLLEMLKSLVERGVIDPTELNYGLFDQEEILFLLDGLADISLLNWSLEGAGSVTEGDTTTYTVSYTGVTLSPGQMVTISVATGGGFDSNPDDATPGSDYTTLGTVLTFTGGGPTSQTVAVSTIDDTIVEG
ncbi:MAG: hypothetical protein SGJ07_05605, partial [Rhodospirillaceae bacterium]|nr:hypothetical protein [Rhodospirillaceae bacterium]